MTPSQQFVFDMIVGAAKSHKRCPQKHEFKCGKIDVCNSSPALIGALAKAGWLRIEISGHNYRTIEILQGPYKGLRTLGDPSRARIWKMIGPDGLKLDTNVSRRVAATVSDFGSAS